MNKMFKRVTSSANKETSWKHSSVNSRDATLHHLYNMVRENPSDQSHQELSEHLEMRMRTDRIFETIFEDINVEETI